LTLRRFTHDWRKTEWIGHYFEFEANKILREDLGVQPGPLYGSTKFDCKIGNTVWDLKSHVSNVSSDPWVITNDENATNQCIRDYGGVGIVVAIGNATYDTDLAFKKWHDTLKGDPSAYVKRREKEGGWHRQRKSSFDLARASAYWLDAKLVDEGHQRGWIIHHHQGRNSNDAPRPPKYQLNLNAAIAEARLSSFEVDRSELLF